MSENFLNKNVHHSISLYFSSPNFTDFTITVTPLNTHHLHHPFPPPADLRSPPLDLLPQPLPFSIFHKILLLFKGFFFWFFFSLTVGLAFSIVLISHFSHTHSSRCEKSSSANHIGINEVRWAHLEVTTTRSAHSHSRFCFLFLLYVVCNFVGVYCMELEFYWFYVWYGVKFQMGFALFWVKLSFFGTWARGFVCNWSRNSDLEH